MFSTVSPKSILKPISGCAASVSVRFGSVDVDSSESHAESRMKETRVVQLPSTEKSRSSVWSGVLHVLGENSRVEGLTPMSSDSHASAFCKPPFKHANNSVSVCPLSSPSIPLAVDDPYMTGYQP